MENNQEEKRERPLVSTVSAILPTGDLVELVYDPKERRTALAVGSPGGVSVEDFIDFGGTRLVPWKATNNLIRHETLLLPGEAGGVRLRVRSPWRDRRACREVRRSHSRVQAGHRRVRSPHLGLRRLQRGSVSSVPGRSRFGKTRALIVAGGLCNRAFFASGASTVSPIFHTLDTFRGTLILDEADFRFSDEKAELSKILNNGNVRGFPVLRTMFTPTKEFDPRAFIVYGPKGDRHARTVR